MKNLGLIEKYIQNKVTAEELAEIKRLVAEDAAFKQELSFHLELREAVKRAERHQLKQRLQNLEQDKKARPLFHVLWKIAAVFIIGLGLLWFFIQPTYYDKLYTQHFEPYPNIVAPAVRNTTKDDIQQAFNDYENRNYKKAAVAFKVLYDRNKAGYANFYYGISLMADNRIEQAIKALENPAWKVPEKYQTPTNWYLALGYLKLEKKEQAKTYLKKVVETGGAKGEQARELMEKI